MKSTVEIRKSKIGMIARCASVVLGRHTHIKGLDAWDQREQRRDELGNWFRPLGNPLRMIEENSDDKQSCRGPVCLSFLQAAQQ